MRTSPSVLAKSNKGENHPFAILTESKVRVMRRLYWVKGISSGCLAKLYSINSPETVWDAMVYRTWRHVKDTFTEDEIHPNRR